MLWQLQNYMKQKRLGSNNLLEVEGANNLVEVEDDSFTNVMDDTDSFNYEVEDDSSFAETNFTGEAIEETITKLENDSENLYVY